jgi:hypothetical protein
VLGRTITQQQAGEKPRLSYEPGLFTFITGRRAGLSTVSGRIIAIQKRTPANIRRLKHA